MHTEEERVEDLKDVCYAGGEDGCGGVAATKLLKTALSFFICILISFTFCRNKIQTRKN